MGKKLKSSLVETPTPSTHQSELTGELTDNPSGANALSTNIIESIPKFLLKKAEKEKNFVKKLNKVRKV